MAAIAQTSALRTFCGSSLSPSTSPVKYARLLLLVVLCAAAAWLYKTRYVDRFADVESDIGTSQADDGGASSANAPAGKAIRVLFIGNSLTHTENMPAMLAGLARAGNVGVEVVQHSPGGATLADHAANPAVHALLDAGRWDFVVIQEQSQRPAFAEDQVRKDSDPGVAAIVRRARAGSPGVRIMFYMHFAHRDGDRRNAASLPEVSTYDGMQQRLNASYRRWAREQNGTIVPVGAAWRKVRVERPDIDLYRDDSHPNKAGAYLVACVFYVSLFEQSPVGSAFSPGLDPTVATVLQQAALDTWKVEP